MASTSTPASVSERRVIHDPRAEAGAAFERGMDLLAGVALGRVRDRATGAVLSRSGSIDVRDL